MEENKELMTDRESKENAIKVIDGLKRIKKAKNKKARKKELKRQLKMWNKILKI